MFLRRIYIKHKKKFKLDLQVRNCFNILLSSFAIKKLKYKCRSHNCPSVKVKMRCSDPNYRKASLLKREWWRKDKDFLGDAKPDE